MRYKLNNNPRWFNIVIAIHVIIQIIALFNLHYHYNVSLSLSQFSMGVFSFTYALKERKTNRFYTILFSVLATVFLYLSWSTLQGG